ncbi:hypothetical protein [uncultured Brevibacillus sp.]|uniref:hypothetical protein n=1 Tax=uncultured Brevibacillus sp. TaxID=169970 RepID=UPI00259936D4|nr:hypothetical protein [uncultured Brevibacillus sp.]
MGSSWNNRLFIDLVADSARQSYLTYHLFPSVTIAQTLSKAGYATDPEYAAKLTRIIDTYNLTQYDQFTPEEPSAYPQGKLDLGKRALKEGLVTSPE